MKGLADSWRGIMVRKKASAPAVEFATFWQGPVDPLTYTCLASFPHHGIRLRLYSYDPEIEVPKGIEVCDARLIVPDETRMRRYLVNGRPSLARFANSFRYEMIRLTQICWVDADILCLKTPELPWAGVVFGRQDDWGKHAFNGAVLRFPPDHPILESLIEETSCAIDVDSTWGTLGPELLTRLIRKHDIQRLSRKRQEFYPIAPHSFWKLLLADRYPELCDITRDSTFIHLWQQMFKWSHYDLSKAPPVGSFLYQEGVRLGTLHRFAGVYDEMDLRELLGDVVRE